MTTPTHLSTREAAAACGLTDTAVRWYERIGLLDRVARGSDRRRRFSPSDVSWLQLLSRLRATGMPVRTMLRYAELVRHEGNEAERLELLRAHRAEVVAALQVQRECLELLEKKIETYQAQLCTRESL